jgi:hypothetical protein
MKWYSTENADTAGKSTRHAKDGGFFASNAEAQVRKNRKEDYTPSNEGGEALHGLIGLKHSILSFFVHYQLASEAKTRRAFLLLMLSLALLVCASLIGWAKAPPAISV